MAQEVVIGLGNAYIKGGGVHPEGNVDITENGVHDVADYATATVEVPGIVPTGTRYVYENGTYDVAEYAEADVSVPYQVALLTYDLNGADGVPPSPELAVKMAVEYGGETYRNAARLNMPTVSTSNIVRWGTGTGQNAPHAIPPTGKVFDGWAYYTDSQSGGSAAYVSEDRTLYAIWVNA